MKQAIGSIPSYNIIIIFIVLTFGFLSATLSYMKAFKVNSIISKALENYEGYNDLSDKEIANNLSTLGYRLADKDSLSCPERNGKTAALALNNKKHYYCIYENDYYGQNTKYFNYGVVTYIFVDLPAPFDFKVPVYTETEKIYRFTEGWS